MKTCSICEGKGRIKKESVEKNIVYSNSVICEYCAGLGVIAEDEVMNRFNEACSLCTDELDRFNEACREIGKLQDSGRRTTFETGAVREMGGKGRCDLMPALALIRLSHHYEAGAEKYGPNSWEKGMPISSCIDSALRHILKYNAGLNDEDHLAAAVWNILAAMEFEERLPEMQDLYYRKEDC